MQEEINSYIALGASVIDDHIAAAADVTSGKPCQARASAVDFASLWPSLVYYEQLRPNVSTRLMRFRIVGNLVAHARFQNEHAAVGKRRFKFTG